MAIEVMDTKKVVEAVQDAVSRHGATQDELIPILNDVNRAVGYLPSRSTG